MADMNGQRGIQSLEVGVRMFQAVSRLGGSVTLGQLAKLSGMPPSKAHRYCVSLIHTGLLQRDGRGLYGMGPLGFQLAHAVSSFEHARALAVAALPRLAHDLGETAFVSAWGNTGPRILHVADADKPISIRPNTRHDLPLHNSATGRVFAADLAPAQLESLLAAEFRQIRQTDKLSAGESAARHRAVTRQLADVRRRGLARTVGERYAGLNSFSVPIFDHNGRVILALTSFGLAASFPSSWESRIAQALRTTAAELTLKIGGEPRKSENGPRKTTALKQA